MASVLQIGFLGVEEGTDPKAQAPGTLLRAVNCRMDKDRRLSKRYGTTGLPKAVQGQVPVAAGVRLLTDGKLTALTDGDIVYARSETNNNWNRIDREPPFVATKRAHVDTTRSVVNLDTAIYGDFIVSHYSSLTGGNGTFFQVDSLSTGQNIFAPTNGFPAGTVSPRVVIDGAVAFFFGINTGTGFLQVFSFDLTAMAVTNVNSVVLGGVPSSPPIDVVAAAGTLYVTCSANAGGSRAVIFTVNETTLALVTQVNQSSTLINAVSVAYDAIAGLITWCYASDTPTRGVYCQRFSLALTSVVGPTLLTNSAGIAATTLCSIERTATTFMVGWSHTVLGSLQPRFESRLYDSALGYISNSDRYTFNTQANSKPWRIGIRVFISLVTTSDRAAAFSGVSNADKRAQASTTVAECEFSVSLTGTTLGTHPHVGTLESYTGIASYPLVRGMTDASGAVWLASPYRDREPQSMLDVVPIGWNLYRLTAGGVDWSRGAQLAGSSLLAGAAPVWFDGESCMPYGFAQQPTIMSASVSTGGSMAVNTSYSYVATYAWRDAKGLLHRSAPSPPVTIATGATGTQVNLTFSTSSLSAKVRTLALGANANPITIEIWRTIGGATSNHYLLTQPPLATFMCLNDPRVATVTYQDNASDASIIGATYTGVPLALAAQQQLYTDTGELPNLPPPAFTTCVTHRNRLIGIGPDEKTLWFSKDYTEDLTLAPGFSAALTQTFSRRKTALASLDSGLVAFGEDHIDVVSGDGPDDTGTTGGWAVEGVQTDLGCINPRSVVVFQDGVLFQSRVGIALLDRGKNVTWFSKSIDDTLDAYPNITSATLISEETEVRWTCDDGTNGVILVFDYQMKIWFVRQYADVSDSGATSVRFTDAALIGGVYTLLTAGGQVYRETDAHCLDGGTTYVERDILLAPISAQPGRTGWANDNLKWSRVKDLTLMGTSVSNHDLEVSFAHDYNAFTQTRSFLAGDDVTSIGPLEKGRITLRRQKCQAVQIRIRDLKPTAYPVGASGAGSILEALALRVAAVDGPARTADTQRG